jgi:hypothetical protein
MESEESAGINPAARQVSVGLYARPVPQQGDAPF